MSEEAAVIRQAWSAPDWPSERPSADGSGLEAWCYTDRFSYRPGDEVELRAHSTADTVQLLVIRDGAHPEIVLEDRFRGRASETPEDAYATGCGWPVATRFEIGGDWQPGLYLLVISAMGTDGRVVDREHFIVVRSALGTDAPRLALMLTTSTLMAYNDWGGANHYRGVGDTPWVDTPSPVVSARRPLARGFLRLPKGAPRESNHHTPRPNEPPRYKALEWSRAHDYSRHYADAFWATYERPFVVWAERAGYELDYLTQHDLHFDPEALSRCSGLVIAGHDEYWTWEMRDAVDSFVDDGGQVGRFAGNFTWQVRLSGDGAEQHCFKVPALDTFSTDPETRHLTTTRWEAVDRPGAATMGLTGTAGIYNRYGDAAPRSSGGYTLYRPEHWALEGTGLRYGDLLGGPPAYAATFELDGVDFTFERGLPFATGTDGAPENLEIVAMAPAVLGEADYWDGEVALNAPEGESGTSITNVITGEKIPRNRYGSGMIASFERGKGSVFNTGSTEWVNGLAVGDEFIERITANVLDRFHGSQP